MQSNYGSEKTVDNQGTNLLKRLFIRLNEFAAKIAVIGLLVIKPFNRQKGE